MADRTLVAMEFKPIATVGNQFKISQLKTRGGRDNAFLRRQGELFDLI